MSVADYLDFYADDPATAVGLAYIEGVTRRRGADGAARRRRGAQAAGRAERRRDGGRGARGGEPHRRAGGRRQVVRRSVPGVRHHTCAATVEEAFEAAATFATQPLPKGPNVVVLTTAGGWGVVTADAITARPDLRLLELPDDLLAAIDEHLPPRWSRNNPVDCAGGETRDTIPTVMRLIAEHADVDAIVYLGLGIQSNQARMMREGRFYPGHGLERIVEYHERQDRRFAEAAAAAVGPHRQADPVRNRAGGRRSGQPRPGGGARHRPARVSRAASGRSSRSVTSTATPDTGRAAPA